MDLKEFLDEYSDDVGEIRVIPIKLLGLFFWERGGKQFYLNSKKDWAGVEQCLTFIELVNNADYEVNHGYDDERNDYYARDFLDALACLGEEKVKELIKELV